LVALGIRSEQSIARHERRYLLLALAVFGLFAAYHAYTVPLWFDELFTLFISRLNSLPEMLRAMPADGQPPLQYLLTHLSLRIFGEKEFAIRLPELVAYLATGLLTYRIVRRHGTAIQALFAMASLLGATISIDQAFTARPYGLLIAFTALVFACWQSAALREHSRFLPLCGVALGIAGAILSHHFGVIYVGLFLAAGETVRLVQRRRLDGGMIVAIAVGLSPLALTLPLARQSHVILGEAVLHAANYGGRPTLMNLLMYLQMAAFPLLCLAAVLAPLPWPERTSASRSSASPPVPAHEWAATAALSLLLPIQMLLAALETGVLAPRYTIGTSLGLALLLGWAMPQLRLGHLRTIPYPALALSILFYLLLVASTLSVEMMHQPVWSAQPAAEAVSPLLLNAPPDFPIVVANLRDYPVEWWYSPPSIKPRINYLSDVPYAVQQADFLGELSMTWDRAYIPLRTTDYAAFIANHPRFLLLCTGDSHANWVPPRLASSGWHLNLVARSGKDVLYWVDRP
jgi:4-amino-4-deoxy-L-arabinose transferase-like glycosyltransferase